LEFVFAPYIEIYPLDRASPPAAVLSAFPVDSSVRHFLDKQEHSTQSFLETASHLLGIEFLFTIHLWKALRC